MNSSFDLHSLKSAETLRIALMNLAVNSPEYFQWLMKKVNSLMRSMFNKSFYDRLAVIWDDEDCSFEIPIIRGEAIEHFAERCAKERANDCTKNVSYMPRHGTAASPPTKQYTDEIEKNLELYHYSDESLSSSHLDEIIRRLQYSRAADAIIFLLERASPEVQKSFLNNFLSPDELARRAHVTMVVRHNPRPPRGNIGHYLIFASKEGGEERLLHFTNQASSVYYLMYLIDRYQRQGVLQPLDLGTNREQFFKLYYSVYDISPSALEQRIQNLLYREENGKIRVGRLRELIYDIRLHLEDLFVDYDEAVAPYVMTAYRHLEIGAEHIFFEDEDLLRFNFR